jgi:hypothetical protein
MSLEGVLPMCSKLLLLTACRKLQVFVPTAVPCSTLTAIHSSKDAARWAGLRSRFGKKRGKPMKTPREILDELSVWARQRHGRQAKLSARLGVKPQTFCDWAAGRSTPKWEIGLKIQEFLGKSDMERRQAIGDASPNLYILASVMSGTGKSDVLREFRVPIDEMEDALTRDHNKKSARLETELRCLEIDIKELEKKCKKGADPDLKEEMASLLLKKKELSDLASFSPRLLLDDTTSERAAALLQASGEQLALISPDAGDVAHNLLGKYRKGNNTDEYLYLKAFSREHAKVDRIGRPAICLKEPCMSIMLFFQPDILQLLFSNERLRRGGFLARCLIVDTQAKAQMIDGVVRPIREDIKAHYHARSPSCCAVTDSLPNVARLTRRPRQTKYFELTGTNWCQHSTGN